MAEEEKPQGRVVDFNKFFPSPRNTFAYRDGKRYPAFAPEQLGEKDRASLQRIRETLQACETSAEQLDVVIDAIVTLCPTAPAGALKDDPFEAVFGSLVGLLELDDDSTAARPTKPARRRKSASRRTTAK